MKFRSTLGVLVSASLVFLPIARAQSTRGNTGNGNNGNGVGNTGPGNQGNDTTNGNAGGTTGSTTGGTSTGSSTGGTTGSTGGLNGGNNGNGVGNTGPGNQGNETTNGNAGGTTGSTTGGSSTGSSTGGSTGSSNGSTTGLNGGNNGNGVGNTGPGNQGNDSSNGNAGGTTGSTTGGSSTGSSTGGTTGGSTGSTTGLNGGNNGNGVGNTGPGNQGNDSSNGNAGGTTGSTTGGSSTGSSTNGNANGSSTNGSSTGSSTNGNANGSSTNGSTGGLNGGNNGNGVGNTGPGNQGNDSDNGNAGGTTGATNGGTNGNANGNANGGSNGNTNGNTNGGTTGGTTGETTGGSTGANTAGGSTTGETTGGNTAGGSTTGETTGGNTAGGSTTGETTGGNTAGGSSTGETTGGNTAGGSTTGETTGGSSTGETTGGTTTGETTGGSTAGETTGGSTGETTGGEEGGSTGGDEGGESTGGDEGGESTGGDEGGEDNTTPVEEQKPEKKLKARVLPLVFGNYDIFKKIVNLTTTEVQTANTPVILDDYRNGFQVSQMRQYQVGLGLAPQVFVENATGLMALSTGVVGLSATKGRMVQYERFVSTEEEAQDLSILPIPYKTEQLASYKTGESVYYENLGGVLFMGGVGVAGVFTGGSVVAEGGFKTLITKTGMDKVTVNMVKSSIRKASLFTGVAVIKLDASTNAQINNGFSYSFDLSMKDAAKAYEQLLAGNAVVAQELSKNSIFTGVMRIDSTKNNQVTRSRGISIGIPMVFMQNWSTGKTYGQTETLFFNDNSKTELTYGVFFKEHNGRFFHKHKKLVRTFYSGKAVNKSQEGKINSQDQLATYLWSYENDAAKSATFRKAVTTFHKDLGLRNSFNPSVVTKEYLGFMRLEAQVDIPESYTRTLMNTTSGREFADVMSKRAVTLISKYFAAGDADELCLNEDDEAVDSNETCKEILSKETINALGKIKGILVQMKQSKDASSFTALQAQMGKEFVRNQFVMGTFFALDTKCEVNFKLKLEGQRMNRMVSTVPANPTCR